MEEIKVERYYHSLFDCAVISQWTDGPHACVRVRGAIVSRTWSHLPPPAMQTHIAKLPTRTAVSRLLMVVMLLMVIVSVCVW